MIRQTWRRKYESKAKTGEVLGTREYIRLRVKDRDTTYFVNATTAFVDREIDGDLDLEEELEGLEIRFRGFLFPTDRDDSFTVRDPRDMEVVAEPMSARISPFLKHAPGEEG